MQPVEDLRPRPRWYIRIRGLLSMSVLVAIIGVLLALSLGVLLILVVVAIVAGLG